MTFMPAEAGAVFSPTDAAQAVRSIERLMAQRRFDEAAALALRALQFEAHRRDVRLLLVRALIGAKRFGEAADEALATLALFPRDVAARTLLRTCVGRLHLAVREVLTRVDEDRVVLGPPIVPDDAVTARHEPFGAYAETEHGSGPSRAFTPTGTTSRGQLVGRKTAQIHLEEIEATADEEPLYGM
jgi:hypothetical protein